MAEIGVTINEFGRQGWVLLEAMYYESGVDLMEKFGIVAEV